MPSADKGRQSMLTPVTIEGRCHAASGVSKQTECLTDQSEKVQDTAL